MGTEMPTKLLSAAKITEPGSNGRRVLYGVLTALTVFALIGLVVLYAVVFDEQGRKAFAPEIGKGLVQLVAVAVLGSVVKLLIDDHQRRLRDAGEARVRVQQLEERLQSFRLDKVRRLVGVTNVLRRVPVLIDAHRSAKTYNEQMREVVDAGLELRLIRHEIGAIGEDPNPAFPAWAQIEKALRSMEAYIKWVESDFRKNSKTVSELQREAERNRDLQPKVWERILEIPSIRDLLEEVDLSSQKTQYATAYLLSYNEAMKLMLRSSL